MEGKATKFHLLVLSVVLAAAMTPVRAGGPLYVTGVESAQPGRPYRWALNPVPYKTDRGGLGYLSNTEANSMVSEAFQVWQNVETSNLTFYNAGLLDYDVTQGNIWPFYNGLSACNSSAQPANSVVYDLDGSLISAWGYDNNSILGFSDIICQDDVNGVYTRGWVLLNGRFIDGKPETPSHQTVTLEEFKGVMIHEFGHLIGLDHSQINLNCLTDTSCPIEDQEGVPTMFPILLDASRQSVLTTDDKSALSALYPAPDFESTTGRIRGHVVFADGQTPAQGYNVIARSVADPRRTAVSGVSGFLFTAGAGNPFVPEGQSTDISYGSRDPSLIGFYDLPGLPPGEYTIEVEAIYNSGNNPFVDGSSVGPIGNYLGFQYKMPGTCNPQYLKYPSSPGDDCSEKSTVTVGAGGLVETNTDVILLGTPPRYDAWEDGP